MKQNIANECFSYNRLTGELTWKVCRKFRRTKGKSAGSINNSGYLVTKVKGEAVLNHRIVWVMHHGYTPENPIDHINRNKLDNRIDNLREVSFSCNAKNSNTRVDNKTGINGVSFGSEERKWVVQINYKGTRHKVGRSSDFVEAVAMRLAAEQCLGWGECCKETTALKYMRAYINDIQPRCEYFEET